MQRNVARVMCTVHVSNRTHSTHGACNDRNTRNEPDARNERNTRNEPDARNGRLVRRARAARLLLREERLELRRTRLLASANR